MDATEARPTPARPDPGRAATEQFLNLVWVDDDQHRWRQPLVAGLTGGRGDLFGGCAVGAVIAGLERCTGRPLVWITGQFLAASRPPDILSFTVDRLVGGRNLSQATVVARVGGADVLAFQAALGSRPAVPDDVRWVPAPAVPSPERCEPAELSAGPGGLRPRFDCRVVPADAATRPGSTRWWFRLDETATGDGPGDSTTTSTSASTGRADLGDPALVAIVLDFVPMALSSALDRPLFGASLDNTVRVVERGPADWVLAEFSLDSLSVGISHITGRVWTADGVLLATGSQTCVISERPSP